MTVARFCPQDEATTSTSRKGHQQDPSFVPTAAGRGARRQPGPAPDAMALLLLLPVLLLLLQLCGASNSSVSLTAGVPNAHIALGEILKVSYTASGPQLPSLRRTHQVFASVNGSLLGAGVDVRSSGVVSVPVPLSGNAQIELLLLQRFAVGALYVGTSANASAALARAPPVAVAVRFVAARRPARSLGAPVVGIEYDLRKGTDPQWHPSGCPGGDAVEGVPIVGRYAASDPLAQRQHAIWMTRLGVDFVTLDWTGICWGESTPVGKTWNGSFADRPLSVQRELNYSLGLLALHETMRDEGHEVPALVPILGLDNGPVASIACLNEALAWLETVRVAHPRAFLPSDDGGNSGSIVLVFDGAGKTRPDNFSAHGFQLTMMASQLQTSPQLAKAGYWSWMDGPGGPETEGKAVTVTPAYFGSCPPHGVGMWLGPDAVGRRGGYTFYQQISAALAAHPKVLLVSQWNEFAGQDNGGGYGADKQCYGDSYSRELRCENRMPFHQFYTKGDHFTKKGSGQAYPVRESTQNRDMPFLTATTWSRHPCTRRTAMSARTPPVLAGACTIRTCCRHCSLEQRRMPTRRCSS